jgi:hypothetical protein
MNDPLDADNHKERAAEPSDDKNLPLTDTEAHLVEKQSPKAFEEPNLVQDMQFERDKQNQTPANKPPSPPVLDNNSPLCKVMNDYSKSLDPQNPLPPSLQEAEPTLFAPSSVEAQDDFAATELEAFYTQEDIKAQEEAQKEIEDPTNHSEKSTSEANQNTAEIAQPSSSTTNNYTNTQNPTKMSSTTEKTALAFGDNQQKTPVLTDNENPRVPTKEPIKTNYWLALLLGTIAIFLTAYLWGRATMWVDEHRNAYMALPVGLLSGIAVRLGGKNNGWRLGLLSLLLVLVGSFLGNVLSAVEPLAVSFKMSYIEIFQIFDFSHVWGFLKDRFILIDTFYYSAALYLGFLIPFFSWKRKK